MENIFLKCQTNTILMADSIYYITNWFEWLRLHILITLIAKLESSAVIHFHELIYVGIKNYTSQIQLMSRGEI